MTSIGFVGETIGAIFRGFELLADSLDEVDLQAFEQYLNLQDAAGPILNPTEWRNMPADSIDRARERVRIIRAIKAQQRKE